MATEIDIVQRPDYVQEFREAWDDAKEGFVRAAHIYATAMRENPDLAKEFRAAIPTIGDEGWRMLDDIGSGRCDARLLFGNAVPHKSRIKLLPGPLQKRILDDEQFDLLVDQNDVLKVKVKDLTSDQADQLFGRDDIRTIPQQKLWLIDKEQRARFTKGEPEEPLPYDFRKGGKEVVLHKNTVFTLNQLRDLVQTMAMK